MEIGIIILILLFLIPKRQKIWFPVINLSAKHNQKLSKLLNKGFERFAFGMNIKQKMRTNVRKTRIDIFSNQVLQELTDFLI